MSHGPLTPDKSSGSTGSTSAAFGVSTTSDGMKESPTLRSLNEPTCLASLRYASKDTYVGSAMYTLWNPIVCQGNSSTGNCRWRCDEGADHSFASRMFANATCDSLKLIPPPGRSLCQTETPGVTEWRRALSRLRRRPGPRLQSSGRRERNDRDQFERPQTTFVPFAVKIATQETCFWVTWLRACRHWCADHHLSETRMPYTKT